MTSYSIKANNTSKALTKKNPKLIQSDNKRVQSHTQREEGEWFINTIIIEGTLTPFRYKRKKPYQNLQGARVNLIYYPCTENLAGIEFEVMNVVRIRRS